MIDADNGRITYGIEVMQKSGEWFPASAGRTREYVDDVFQQYVSNGESCRIVDSAGAVISGHVPQPKERKPIDIARTRFFVTSWPDEKWTVQFIGFLERLTLGVDVHPEYRNNVLKRNRTCARNTAVRRALDSPEVFESFVFIDSDVRPGADSTAFLELDADVKCCEVPMRVRGAWSRPNSFHETFWCTSRSVLEAIEPPWFMQKYNHDGTEMDGCICKSFQKKVLNAGFTIAHGGWAEHDQDGTWC